MTILIFFYTYCVTLLALALYVFTLVSVSAAREKYNVQPPALTGNAMFEKIQRVQVNTSEHLILFLPLLWVGANLVSDRFAAIIGLIWVLARFGYVFAFKKDPSKRAPWILSSMVMNLILFLGSAWALISYSLRLS